MKQRFIAGAVCPKCHEQDSLAIRTTPQERDQVVCVSCGYHALQPEDVDSSGFGERIATLKPE
ncbi:YheV family putative zinc ribbon protein [Celerinatantimonas yamalensis]|uniref:YheV family putative zinc ribbon protein n=1 Tax=Celerinatantimonas yamalensis TaxID=559956 RepID=A0ABW9GBA7_9GAMM